jgi:hypothetical protein
MERRILLFALVPMLFIGGVCGLDFGFSGGNGGDISGYSSHLEADDGVGLSGHFSLQENNLAGNFEFKGVGGLNVHETKTNGKGDSVSLVAKGQLLPGNAYSTEWKGVEESGPIIGTQQLTGTGRNIDCMVEAINRNGLQASVAAGMGRGSIDVLQSGTAFENGVDAWQKINSAYGENIELYAKTSDKSGLNIADSSVKVDHGFLQNYRSEAEATQLNDGVIDLYAIHGAFNTEDGEKNPVGRISGDMISSKGSASNQEGLTARYGVTINYGSVEGRFDWGTETKSNGWLIAVPLESPVAWGGTQGKIKISALKINSNSAALFGNVVLSNDWAKAKWVSVKDWKQGYGFAAPSEAKKT